MRALVCSGFGSGENLELKVRPNPEPGPGEVRVRVLACGANATDWEFVTGNPFYGRISRWFMRGRNVFGSDVLGVVDKLGPGCTRLKTGERVLADTFGTLGGFAEMCVAKEALWVPVPRGVSDVFAAALPQSGTIARAGMRGRAGPGKTVLVNGGGGGSGPLAIQLAAEAGAEVWGVDTGRKADVMREAGAVRTLDFEAEDFTALDARFDLVLDLYGTRPMRRVRRVLVPGGEYLMVGGPMRHILGAGLAMLWTRFTNRRAGLLMVSQGPDALGELLEMVEAERLTPVVGEVTSLDCARQALMDMGARKIGGKLVIVP